MVNNITGKTVIRPNPSKIWKILAVKVSSDCGTNTFTNNEPREYNPPIIKPPIIIVFTNSFAPPFRRALLTEPEILLMDEPLSVLDLPRKCELLDYLDTLSARIQIPIIYVTHSLDELMRLADNVAILHNGKVAAYDKLEKVWHSPTFAPWVMAEQGDMGRTNVLAHHSRLPYALRDNWHSS